MPGVNDWITKAMGDLRSSRKLIKDDNETLDTAAYHTQQCAEKSLKAFLIFKGQKVPKTHDLETLLEYCLDHDQTFAQLRNGTEALSSYATYTRYPDDCFDIDREEVLDAIKHAESILKFVKEKIEHSEIQPQLKLF